ncbi:hypothetical protein VNO80_05507 [Phaseolus coccineus]|uniref:Uncharacterized protein n=1 Tax=Phaseolus coccineus TaxID=3886 RepID=A0AAN9RI39_PHACN
MKFSSHWGFLSSENGGSLFEVGEWLELAEETKEDGQGHQLTQSISHPRDDGKVPHPDVNLVMDEPPSEITRRPIKNAMNSERVDSVAWVLRPSLEHEKLEFRPISNVLLQLTSEEKREPSFGSNIRKQQATTPEEGETFTLEQVAEMMRALQHKNEEARRQALEFRAEQERFWEESLTKHPHSNQRSNSQKKKSERHGETRYKEHSWEGQPRALEETTNKRVNKRYVPYVAQKGGDKGETPRSKSQPAMPTFTVSLKRLLEDHTVLTRLEYPRKIDRVLGYNWFA